jgi:hypothetical protein
VKGTPGRTGCADPERRGSASHTRATCGDGGESASSPERARCDPDERRCGSSSDRGRHVSRWPPATRSRRRLHRRHSVGYRSSDGCNRRVRPEPTVGPTGSRSSDATSGIFGSGVQVGRDPREAVAPSADHPTGVGRDSVTMTRNQLRVRLLLGREPLPRPQWWSGQEAPARDERVVETARRCRSRAGSGVLRGHDGSVRHRPVIGIAAAVSLAGIALSAPACHHQGRLKCPPGKVRAYRYPDHGGHYICTTPPTPPATTAPARS